MSRELEEFRKNSQAYLRRRHEVPIPQPTSQELRRSRLYFVELTDALQHYSNQLGTGQFHTFSVRTSEKWGANSRDGI